MADVTITGLRSIEVDEEAISGWIEDRLNDARNVFVRQMSRGQGGGRYYRRRGRLHRASAPGEYPVTDTGRLVSSVYVEMHDPLQGSLISDLRYANILASPGRWKRRMLAEALSEAMASAPPLPPGVRARST